MSATNQVENFENNVNQSLSEGCVTNYMNGVSFKLTPLKKLEFIMASSIFGEPKYYEKGDAEKEEKRNKRMIKEMPELFLQQLLFPEWRNVDASVATVQAVKDALDFDFKATLEMAIKLRNEYNMRLNPQVIVILASLHPKRQEFNQQNPLLFRNCVEQVLKIPTDLFNQFNMYLRFSETKSKNKLPGIVKKCWASKIESMSSYHLKKYLTSGHIIDMIRLSHPRSSKNPHIEEIVKTGDLKVTEEEKTWETLKSQGLNWDQITDQIDLPHMACLRNLRNLIYDESVSDEKLNKVLDGLVKTTKNGKQFPFRYWTSYNEISRPASNNVVNNSKKRSEKYNEKLEKIKNMASDEKYVNRTELCKKALERCLHVALDNYPKLKGRTMSLVDNSGSARSCFNSTYGSVQVSTIANLSGILTAYNSDEGWIGVFGDRLELYKVSKEKSILEQLDEVNKLGDTVGGGTENGIWLFFDRALRGESGLTFDNIFVASDLQASYGQLYGRDQNEYKDYRFNNTNYIDVVMLVNEYRKKINSKVNVFSVQVAGYDNSILPENLYRCSLLCGWTGNEALYANEMIRLWDELENNNA